MSVLQYSTHLFPQYYMVPFKTLVYSESDSARADLALVEKTLTDWWIVEVESSGHHFDTHVFPQIRTLANAAYGTDEAQTLSDYLPAVDRYLLADLVKGRPPRILVVVNSPVPDWIQPLRRYDAEVAVLEVFRSDQNKRTLRYEGFMPTPATRHVSACYFETLLPGFLAIESPATLSLPASGKVVIMYQSCQTEWERVESKEKIWLAPASANPLKTGMRYELIRHQDGSLEIFPKGKVSGPKEEEA